MRPSFLASLLSSLVLAVSACGEITVLDHYRLGEDDPPTQNVSEITTRDSSGNTLGANHLTGHVVGDAEFGEALHPAYYFNPGSSPAALKLGSTLGIGFDTVDTDGVPYDSLQPSSFASTDFGIEGWFRPESATDFDGLVYNGNWTSRGFGLFTRNGTYQGHLGGVGFIDSGVAVTNEWTYFALVHQGGVTSLYVNGTTPIVSLAMSVNPAIAGDTFVVGSNTKFGGSIAQWGLDHLFVGQIDEVRVFEFQSGAFNAQSDLLHAAPEPSAGLAFLAGLGTLAGLRRSRPGT
jgi:hypothetical protein